MFIWMKLNGIEDTQSLIEEKARDANGKYSYSTTTEFRDRRERPRKAYPVWI